MFITWLNAHRRVPLLCDESGIGHLGVLLLTDHIFIIIIIMRMKDFYIQYSCEKRKPNFNYSYDYYVKGWIFG